MVDETQYRKSLEEYATHLQLFMASHRDELEIKNRRELSLFEEWQSRVSGGALLKFLRFITGKKNLDSQPVLREIQQQGRKLLVITDMPGGVAANDILRMFRPSAIWMLREEWRAWCQRLESQDQDFRFHFEYRNWWTREIKPQWKLPISLEDQHWIHREGYTLDRNFARDVCHLWEWTGNEMKLLNAAIEMERT